MSNGVDRKDQSPDFVCILGFNQAGLLLEQRGNFVMTYRTGFGLRKVHVGLHAHAISDIPDP